MTINEILETVSKLKLDDQSMLSEIIRNRVIEAKRDELVKAVRESRAEYSKGLTGHGSVKDFLKELENE
ncbi:MAG: hypothetical protein KKH32_08915 [Bacteroidetes bacterium]|nr:hypothetical protein [Bacteroidota bacterium]